MAEREWTKEQRLAIDAESGTVLVSAAAGSGKTSVLVERIVRKLTDPALRCPPESLLVVTFTSAAAAEMRGRIMKRVREKAMNAAGEEADYLRALAARLGEMPVCTMDAYCMQLVRENFSECGVEPDFSVLDEGEEKALKNGAVQEVVEELYNAGSVDFLSLTALFESGRDDSGLTEGILALSDFSMSEPDPAAWLAGVADHFIPVPAGESVWGKILLQRFLRGAEYCITLLRAAIRDVENDDRLAEKILPLLEADLPAVEHLRAAVLTGDWDTACGAIDRTLSYIKSRRFPTVRGLTEDPVKICTQKKRGEVKDTLTLLLDLCCATEAENREDIAALAPAANALIGAVRRFNDLLLEKKRARNRYGFSDISHFALGLLYDPAAPDEKTPLARELSAGFREILIDEYQDTNRAQDQLFTSLSANGENMFMVGDVKQSIYRFRLASPELFTEKCRKYPYYDGVAKKSKIVLDKNFRSRREVTSAVNYLFSAVMSAQFGEIDYGADERLDPAANYPADDLHAPELYLIDPGDEDETAAEAAFCAQLIRRQIAGGLTVYEDKKTRPARYGDFCILLRAAKKPAETYAAALHAAGIPVNVDTRDGFFDAAEVKMLLSFLRVIDNPLRDVDLLALLLSPVGGFGVQQTAKLRSDAVDAAGTGRVSLYRALLFAEEQGDAAAAGLLARLRYFRRAAATDSAEELIRRVFDETPMLHAAGAMESGALRVANLRALYESAVQFSADGVKTLGAFLRYVETLRENGVQLRKGTAQGEKNSVSIMTMHRSKGLEFPFVIVGGLSRRFNLREASSVLSVSHEYGVGLKRREPENIKLYDSLSSVAVRYAGRDASLSEELRIYYVALTRAREKLFLLAAAKDPGKKADAVCAVLPDGDRVPPFFAGGAATPLSWFLAAFLRHPDAKPLRRLSGVTVPADFSMRFAVVVPDDAPEETEAAPTVSADPALTARLCDRLSYSYRYLPVANALAKHTASALKEETFSPLHFAEAAPAFMYKDRATPADVGTATHKFLELCDFSSPAPDVDAQLAGLVSAGRMTAQEAELLNREAIRTFFASPVFARVLRAEAVIREREFTMAKPVVELDPAVPAEFADEKTVVIGKTDLVFIEDGKAVIVDYKTDRVARAAELLPRYADQLALYAEAVKKAWGYDVKEKILYSLHKSEFITL